MAVDHLVRVPPPGRFYFFDTLDHTMAKNKKMITPRPPDLGGRPFYLHVSPPPLEWSNDNSWAKFKFVANQEKQIWRQIDHKS